MTRHSNQDGNDAGPPSLIFVVEDDADVARLILGALNLLPVRPMDGGRLLWLLTALCTEPYTADRVAYAVGAVASAALLVLCLYLTLTTGAGLFLLPGVLWLAVKGVLPNGAKPDKMNCYKK